jgi:hypothetical protein
LTLIGTCDKILSSTIPALQLCTPAGEHGEAG